MEDFLNMVTELKADFDRLTYENKTLRAGSEVAEARVVQLERETCVLGQLTYKLNVLRLCLENVRRYLQAGGSQSDEEMAKVIEDTLRATSANLVEATPHEPYRPNEVSPLPSKI